jgi:hypothetical protein
MEDGQRASALRFGDGRVQALLGVLLMRQPISNRVWRFGCGPATVAG